APSSPGATDGGSVLLAGNLDEFFDQGVDRVAFDDGTVGTRATLRTMLLAQASTAGNDTVVGFNTDETITGGHGDDNLQGAGGNDTYVYNRGDGNDTIFDANNSGNADTLVLHGVATSAVSLARNGNNVTLAIAPSSPGATDGGSVLLAANLDEFFDQGVDRVAFDDGTVWTRGDLRTRVLPQLSTPSTATLVRF